MSGVLQGLWKKIRHPSYERKKSRTGFLFIAPWLVGSIWFFLIPFMDSFIYSFNKITINLGSLDKVSVGFSHYKDIFTGDPTFLIIAYDVLNRIWYEIILTIVFSVFLALLMNGKYKGRILVRAVFFLPVIIASGVIVEVFNSASVVNGMMSGAQQTPLFQGIEFSSLLLKAGVSPAVTDVLMRIINSIFALVWRSGVQTILLLSGLQTVPKTAYEAAQIEGATPWEIFWKITFPLLTPILVLCSFYTVVDLSNDPSHLMVKYIYKFAKINIGYASALANIWFLFIVLIVALIFLIFRKRTFFEE